MTLSSVRFASRVGGTRYISMDIIASNLLLIGMLCALVACVYYVARDRGIFLGCEGTLNQLEEEGFIRFETRYVDGEEIVEIVKADERS
tara:strand:- start:229 stop:495 length:267 start_codon:yes stop_codon:yes gene_type:complete